MKARLDAGFHRHDGRENVDDDRCLYILANRQLSFDRERLLFVRAIGSDQHAVRIAV